MKNNLLVQMIYRIVMCCVSALAVLLTFHIFYVGDSPHDINWYILTMYTHISNYFVFAVSVIITVDNVRRVKAGEREGHNKKVRSLKFMTTVMILVTFLIYSILLGKPYTLDFWRRLDNLAYHVFAPLLFILDFFLFDEHRTVSVFDPLKSLIIPLVYVAYILILGACVPDFKYPYFFLDVNKLGYGGVILWVFILVVVFTVLGYLMWLYDKIVKVNGKWKLDFSPLKKKKSVAVETVAVEESAPAETSEDEKDNNSYN